MFCHRVACGLLFSICAVWAAAPAAADQADPAASGHASGAEAHASFGERIAAAAIARTMVKVRYDPAYRSIAYPGGDVPQDRGVCTDLVIRSLRAVGVDLQALVHEDMRAAFDAYPSMWGAARPDPNIDHRRAPNLETYFTRANARRPPSTDPADFEPGDIVAWNLRTDAGFLPHIGVVTGMAGASGWPLVVHNIGAGPQLEDVLFQWPMTGHYRIEAP